MVAGVVGAGDGVHHLLGDAPHGEGAVPRPRHQELVVQPRLVEDPVTVGALPHADGVQGGQSGDTW